VYTTDHGHRVPNNIHTHTDRILLYGCYYTDCIDIYIYRPIYTFDDLVFVRVSHRQRKKEREERVVQLFG